MPFAPVTKMFILLHHTLYFCSPSFASSSCMYVRLAIFAFVSFRVSNCVLLELNSLSLALSGQIREAFDLFNERIGSQNPMLGSYLAYDAGDAEKAYSYAQMLDKDFFMETNRDWYLFLADLCMDTGVVNEAAALYADFVNALTKSAPTS